MKIKVSLVPPRDGKLPVKRGDRVMWDGSNPYRLDIDFGDKENETESPER